MDLEAHAFVVLEKAGTKRGKTVLDFGCGSGTYTILAAKIVGKEEIESANFYRETEYSGTLIHDNEDIEKGKVLNFRKRQ